MLLSNGKTYLIDRTMQMQKFLIKRHQWICDATGNKILEQCKPGGIRPKEESPKIYDRC